MAEATNFKPAKAGCQETNHPRHSWRGYVPLRGLVLRYSRQLRRSAIRAEPFEFESGHGLVGETDGIFVAHGANRGKRSPKRIGAVEDGGITGPDGISITNPVKYAAVFDGFGLGLSLSRIWRCGLQI